MSETRSTPQRILVIGAGISGLAAAHRIVETRPDVHVELWESQDRVGGVLSTKHEDGFQVEESADNFITTVPWGLDLCKRLGLSDELVQTNPECRRTFVLHRSRLHLLPDGFLMMAPTKMWPLAVTPLLSPWGKLRAGLEFFIPPKRDDEDESMASFGRRRLGREVFERLVEPLVSGVYGADMEKLSLLATLPRFRDMEKEHGSMIRAMRHEMAARRKAAKTSSEGNGKTNGPGQSGARYSMFVTLKEGLGRLTGELAERISPERLRLSTKVERLERREETGHWIATSSDGTRTAFDAVIVATPSFETARLLKDVDETLAADVESIEHTGTAIVTVAFERDQVGHALDAAGFVVPRLENTPILAASFSSRKYPHRAPDEKVLLRIFAGGARAPEMATMDDGPLVETLLSHIRPTLRIEGEPIYATVAHWPRTMPQYHVGHLDLVERIEQRVAERPGLALAGNAFHGVGVPACIHSGEQAADRLLADKR